jgi:hypothetical protein
MLVQKGNHLVYKEKQRRRRIKSKTVKKDMLRKSDLIAPKVHGGQIVRNRSCGVSNLMVFHACYIVYSDFLIGGQLQEVSGCGLG